MGKEVSRHITGRKTARHKFSLFLIKVGSQSVYAYMIHAVPAAMHISNPPHSNSSGRVVLDVRTRKDAGSNPARAAFSFFFQRTGRSGPNFMDMREPLNLPRRKMSSTREIS